MLDILKTLKIGATVISVNKDAKGDTFLVGVMVKNAHTPYFY